MVKSLSRHARFALKISADKSGIRLGELFKDSNGAPLPFHGNYWSVTHKPEYVAGIVAKTAMGIDVEKIRSCNEALFRKVADDNEWGLTDDDPFIRFFRFWTAKEAVLKAAGTGITGLNNCRIFKVKDNHRLIIHYISETWQVESFYFDRHIASVVNPSLKIKWTLYEY